MEASIAFRRAMRVSHQALWTPITLLDQNAAGWRGISHSSQLLPRMLFSSPRGGSSLACQLSQITSISALLAMDFRVTCGARS